VKSGKKGNNRNHYVGNPFFRHQFHLPLTRTGKKFRNQKHDFLHRGYLKHHSNSACSSMIHSDWKGLSNLCERSNFNRPWGWFTNYVYKGRGVDRCPLFVNVHMVDIKFQRRGVGGQKKPKSCQLSL
jgi:hypothetical protein